MDTLSDSASRVAAPIRINWEDWRQALPRFATATGLCVSAYDAAGERTAGPYASAKVAQYLVQSGIFESSAPGDALERSLALRAMECGSVQREALLDQLEIEAMPIAAGDRPAGVIVYGWVFHSFSTAMACEQLARHLHVSGVRLWAEARLESPVPRGRMVVYRELLETLIESAARHQEAIARLDQLAGMREVFLAKVSHELRTPLTALSMRVELLSRSSLENPDRIRAVLDKIKVHVAEEVRLLEDLIDASRTRTGQLSIDRQDTILTAVLQAALSSVQPLFDSKGVTLDAERLEGLPAQPLSADRHRLQQVFWNLLTNALKFTPQGGCVAIAVIAAPDRFAVEITDTGRGIEPAMLARIFEPFTRQREGNERGLGLGLSIARHIVEAHGGTIQAESAGSGAGSTFRVLLPRRMSA